MSTPSNHILMITWKVADGHITHDYCEKSLIKSHEILRLKSTIPDNTVITIIKHAFEIIGLNLSNVQL